MASCCLYIKSMSRPERKATRLLLAHQDRFLFHPGSSGYTRVVATYTHHFLEKPKASRQNRQDNLRTWHQSAIETFHRSPIIVGIRALRWKKDWITIVSSSSTPPEDKILMAYLPDSCTVINTIPFVSVLDMNTDLLILDPSPGTPSKPLLRQAQTRNCRDIVALRSCLNEACTRYLALSVQKRLMYF